MIKIKKIDDSNFNNIDFNIMLGEKRTYNEYFSIIIDSIDLRIGLQTVTGGINPKIEILNDETILINGLKEFYGLSIDGTIIKTICSDMVFYDFKIVNNNVLIIGELELIMLDNKLITIWNHKFSEIVESAEVIGTNVVVKDMEKKLYEIDLKTGVLKTLWL